MNEYMKNWKAEHVAIMSFIKSAVELDISSKAGQDKMREVKNMLLLHLKSEDDILYPVLRKAAIENSNLSKTLDVFAREMEEIAPKILAFFKEYEDDPAKCGLSVKFSTIRSMLRQRISKEENIFIKEYENIVGR